MGLQPLEQMVVNQSIKQAVDGLDAQIHVVVEDQCTSDLDEHVVVLWEERSLIEAPLAALIYVAVEQRQARVMSSHHLTESVESSFWDALLEGVGRGFARGEPTAGLTDGIMQLGELFRTVGPATS